MFTIIGGDGKEYGPAPADQIRAWISSGRANLETKAKALGSEEWRRLGDFAEFAGVSAPPPVAAAAPAGYGAPVAATIPSPVATPIAVMTDAADPGRRLVARIIDWIIAWVGRIPGFILLASEVMKVVTTAMQGNPIDMQDFDVPRLIRGGIVLLCGLVVVLVVQGILLSVRGQSIGKILLGLRVVRLSDGGKAGIVHAWLLREAAITVMGTVLAV